MNNHVGSNTMYIFLTLDRAGGGGGPTLFSYNKTTHAVTKVGPLVRRVERPQLGHRRGLVFQRHPAHRALSQRRPRAETLRRPDPAAPDGVRRVDAARRVRLEQIPLATALEQRRPRALGHGERRLVVRRRSAALPTAKTPSQVFYFPRIGDYDECQIDKSGRWLVIKENVDGSARRGQPDHRSHHRRGNEADRSERRRRPLRQRLWVPGRGRQLGQPAQRDQAVEIRAESAAGPAGVPQFGLERRRAQSRESRQRDRERGRPSSSMRAAAARTGPTPPAPTRSSASRSTVRCAC